MLQKMRVGIKGYQVIEALAYIFVQTHLQRDTLPPIVYVNAEQRAQEYASMFRDQFKIDANKVIVLQN
jgi:hypothetical protein